MCTVGYTPCHCIRTRTAVQYQQLPPMVCCPQGEHRVPCLALSTTSQRFLVSQSVSQASQGEARVAGISTPARATCRYRAAAARSVGPGCPGCARRPRPPTPPAASPAAPPAAPMWTPHSARRGPPAAPAHPVPEAITGFICKCITST